MLIILDVVQEVLTNNNVEIIDIDDRQEIQLDLKFIH